MGNGGNFSLWITGLSAAGKSTLAGRVEAKVRALGRRVQVLDGEDVRREIGEPGYTLDSRLLATRRITYLNRLLAAHGVDVIVAAICPVRAGREEARAAIPGFVEVFLDCPVAACAEHDKKGTYVRAFRGEIANVVGIDLPFERSANPEITLATDRVGPDEAAESVMEYLVRVGYLA